MTSSHRSSKGRAGNVAAGAVRRRQTGAEGRRRDAARQCPATETAGVRGDKAGEVVISPVGTRVNVRPEVVELSSLAGDGDLQGRDTPRPASDARAQEIAANYDPARAMPSIEGDRGAPIVGEDNVIDGGNHRVKALQIVYAAHPDKAEASFRRICRRPAITSMGFRSRCSSSGARRR